MAWAGVVRAAERAGVDALIVQDLGALSLVRQIAPNLRIHASTQMTCTDSALGRICRIAGRRSSSSRAARGSSWRYSCTAHCASLTRGNV